MHSRSTAGRMLSFCFHKNKCADAIITFNWNSHCLMTHLRDVVRHPNERLHIEMINKIIISHLHHTIHKMCMNASSVEDHIESGVTSWQFAHQLLNFASVCHDDLATTQPFSALKSYYFRFTLFYIALHSMHRNNVSFQNWNSEFSKLTYAANGHSTFNRYCNTTYLLFIASIQFLSPSLSRSRLLFHY